MDLQQPQQLTKKERRELRRQEKIKEKQLRKQKRLYRRLMFWLLIALVVGGGIFGIIKLASQPPQNTGPAVSVNTISAEDWVKGNREAKVILIEYSDFQCPACAFYYPVLKKISEKFGDKVAIVYRHFPLPIHQNAKPAASAAEAAGIQGKFWEMHDLIFENQKSWSNSKKAKDIFAGYAESLGLNIDQFRNDLKSKEIRAKVDADYKSGIRLGVNATPTFFLNGKKLPNPGSYEEFRRVIENALSQP